MYIYSYLGNSTKVITLYSCYTRITINYNIDHDNTIILQRGSSIRLYLNANIAKIMKTLLGVYLKGRRVK